MFLSSFNRGKVPVRMVPVPLSVPAETVLTVRVSGSGSVLVRFLRRSDIFRVVKVWDAFSVK